MHHSSTDLQHCIAGSHVRHPWQQREELCRAAILFSMQPVMSELETSEQDTSVTTHKATCTCVARTRARSCHADSRPEYSELWKYSSFTSSPPASDRAADRPRKIVARIVVDASGSDSDSDQSQVIQVTSTSMRSQQRQSLQTRETQAFSSSTAPAQNATGSNASRSAYSAQLGTATSSAQSAQPAPRAHAPVVSPPKATQVITTAASTAATNKPSFEYSASGQAQSHTSGAPITPSKAALESAGMGRHGEAGLPRVSHDLSPSSGPPH